MKLFATAWTLGAGVVIAWGQAPHSIPKSASPIGPQPPTLAVQKHRSAVAALNLRIPEVRFDETPLEQVVETLAELAQTNLVVQWRRLEEYGIKRDAAISLHVRNLRLGQILWLVMNQPPLSETKLAYRADADMILLSTNDDLGQEMIVKVYDVQELLQSRLARPTFVSGRQHEMVETVVPNVAAGAVGVRPVTRNYGSGVGVIGQDDGGDTRDPQDEGGGGGGEEDTARERRMQQLINVITTTVEPDAWIANGGNCSVLAWRGNLVVRATPVVHQALGGSIGGTR